MYESTIEKILKSDSTTGPQFLGVFALDELPPLLPVPPACFVFNTKPRAHSGEHWLAMHFDSDGRGTFFDPYGRSPEFYSHTISAYLNQHCAGRHRWKYSHRRIQGSSAYCGLYCTFYLLFTARHKQQQFFNSFGKNLFNNDKFIKNELKKRNIDADRL
jgi:hypothetical protein